MPPQAFVYILRCADGTLYTGYTVDLDRRLRQHRTGNGGKYTRSRAPVELVYSERHKTRRGAMRRESLIKRLPRAKKLLLIGGAKFNPKGGVHIRPRGGAEKTARPGKRSRGPSLRRHKSLFRSVR